MILLTTKTHHKKMLLSLQRLQDRRWIDGDTRVIFVEFTVYNPATSIFVIVTLAFEFVSLGKVVPFSNIATVQLYSLTAAQVAGQIIYLVLTLWYNARVMRNFLLTRNTLMQYFRSIWVFVDWSIVIFTHVAMCVYVVRAEVIEKTLAKSKDSKADRFISFYPAVYWEFLLIYVFSSILTLLVLNVLRLSSYVSKRHAIFASALSGVIVCIVGVTIVYVATFLLTLSMSVILFNESCDGYSTMPHAVIRMLKLYIYDMSGRSNRCVVDKPFINLIFFGGVMFFVAMVWRPLLIICGTVFLFSSGRKQRLQLQEHIDFIDFLWHRFLMFIGYWRLSDYKLHVDRKQAKRVSLIAPHLEWVSLKKNSA